MCACVVKEKCRERQREDSEQTVLIVPTETNGKRFYCNIALVSVNRCRPPPCVFPWAWAAQWCSAASSLPRFTSSCFSLRRTWPHSESQPTASVPQCLLPPRLPAPATPKVPSAPAPAARCSLQHCVNERAQKGCNFSWNLIPGQLLGNLRY